MLYLNEYVYKNDANISEIRKIHYGLYHIEYYVEDCYPSNCCGYISNVKNTYINFFKNNKLFMTKNNISMEPCIIIHGDGSTNDGVENDNTYFTILENEELNMYNMWNMRIRTVFFNDNQVIDFKRVHNNYGIFISYDGVHKYGGLVNLNIFFDINEDVINTNNGFVQIPIDVINDEQYCVTIACDEQGVIFLDLETNSIEERASFADIFYNIYVMRFKNETQINKVSLELENLEI
jgi:hypothetical protein